MQSNRAEIQRNVDLTVYVQGDSKINTVESKKTYFTRRVTSVYKLTMAWIGVNSVPLMAIMKVLFFR